MGEEFSESLLLAGGVHFANFCDLGNEMKKYQNMSLGTSGN